MICCPSGKCSVQQKPALLSTIILSLKRQSADELNKALPSHINPKDTWNYVEDAIEAIEHNLEANFCLLRQIRCNLPYRQNWMHFLTCLTQRDRDAVYKYYTVALNDVRLRGRSISTVHCLIRLLGGEKIVGQIHLTKIKHLTLSNISCEKLCFDLWLRLLEMIAFLERLISLDKSKGPAISAFSELSDRSHRLWKISNETETSFKHLKTEMWSLCLNDWLKLQMKRKSQKNGSTNMFRMDVPNQRVFSNVGYHSLRPMKIMLNEVGNFDTLMANGSNINSREHLSNVKKSFLSNEKEGAFENVDSGPTMTKVTAFPESKCSGSSNTNSCSRGQNLRNGSLNNNSPESFANIRSPASISHSEAQKVISHLSTGSDIVRAPSSDLLLRSPKAERRSALHVNSFLDTSTAADKGLGRQHSNSNVEIFGRNMIKSCSDDLLLKVSTARSRSLDDLNGPQTDKTISLSHSLEDTATFPFDISEHLMSAWDNYQAPYYSIVEGICSFEPRTKFSDTLLWEDLFPDQTEAPDFERRFNQPQARQIDEWSFDGLSATPLSSLTTDDGLLREDDGSHRSDPFLEDADKNPISENSRGISLQPSERHDKCLQTEVDSSINVTLPRSTFLNASQLMPPQDAVTTHTSGYESGPDMVNSLLRRNSLSSVYRSKEGSRHNLSILPPTREFGTQTLLNARRKTTPAIVEEPPRGYLLSDKTGFECIIQSEIDMAKLLDFLHVILAGDNTINDHSPISILGREQRYPRFSSVFTGPKSVYNLMKTFNCVLESAEESVKIFQDPGIWNSTKRAVLLNQWKLLTQWIRGHASELYELHTYQDLIQMLLSRAVRLNQIADTLSNQTPLFMDDCSLPKLQSLVNESIALSEESNSFRDALLKQNFQIVKNTCTITSSMPELLKLETLFVGCFKRILDRIMQDAHRLTELANSSKSAFIFFETIAVKSRNPPIDRYKLGNTDLAPGEQTVNFVAKLISKMGIVPPLRSHLKDNRLQVQKNCGALCKGRVILCSLFLFIAVLIASFYVRGASLTKEQYLPSQCLDATWPGCRAVHIYRIGTPPQ